MHRPFTKHSYRHKGKVNDHKQVQVKKLFINNLNKFISTNLKIINLLVIVYSLLGLVQQKIFQLESAPHGLPLPKKN